MIKSNKWRKTNTKYSNRWGVVYFDISFYIIIRNNCISIVIIDNDYAISKIEVETKLRHE